MLASERRVRILERVAAQQSIQVSELAATFGVSEMTIRRDIARLERDGFLRRAYGGATTHLMRSFDLGFNARALDNAGAKRLIGMTAAGLVENDRTIFVGIGSTTEQFSQSLAARPGLTVVTNSVTIASLLGTRPLRVVGVGGLVRRDELSFVGPIAAATIARYHFDLCVLGAAGVSQEFGMTDHNEDEAEVHRLAIEHATRTMVIADGSKIDEVGMAVVAPLTDIDVFVTDESAAGDGLDRIRAAGTEVVIATAGRAARLAESDRLRPRTQLPVEVATPLNPKSIAT